MTYRRPSRVQFDKVEVGDHVSIVVKATGETISGEVKSVSSDGVGIDYEKYNRSSHGYTLAFAVIPWTNQKTRRLIAKGN